MPAGARMTRLPFAFAFLCLFFFQDFILLRWHSLIEFLEAHKTALLNGSAEILRERAQANQQISTFANHCQFCN